MTNPFEDILIRLDAIDAKISAQPPATPTVPPRIVNTKELCQFLDISEPTVIRYRRKGKIPFMELGGVIRYDLNKVIAALENKKKGK